MGNSSSPADEPLRTFLGEATGLGIRNATGDLGQEMGRCGIVFKLVFLDLGEPEGRRRPDPRFFPGLAHDLLQDPPDGKQVVSGSTDQTLWRWDTTTGDCVVTFNVYAEVNALAPTPGSDGVLLGCGDRTTRLADVAAGECRDTIIRVWALDWECEFPERVDWDDRAWGILQAFLRNHAPRIQEAPRPLTERSGLAKALFGSAHRTSPEKEVAAVLRRTGIPSWTEQRFERLLDTLATAGFGWLSPEAVRAKLETMASQWSETPPAS